LEEVIVGMLSDAQTICEGNLPSDPISYDLDLQPQFNYQWQHSTNGEPYIDIYGENQKELTFDGNDIHFPTKTTHYRLAITRGEGGVRCTGYTDSTTIIVLPKSTQLSSNAPNNTICVGDDVTITAQGSNTFQFIVNGLIRSDASDNQLTLNNLTQTTTVTVRASNSGCSKLHTIVINVIKIDPGTIDLSVDDCDDTSSFKLLSIEAGTINDKSLAYIGGSYQWEYSPDGINWHGINLATEETLQVGGNFTYTAPSHFRRVTQYKLFGVDCKLHSNSIYLENEPTLTGGNISLTQQLVCGNVTPSLKKTLSVTGATVGTHVQYQWEKSTNSGASYTEITGATSHSFSLEPVSQTTSYRRKITWKGDSSCPEYSSVHTLVYLQNNPGSIQSGTVSICYNSVPPQIENKNVALINTGTLTYDWEYSLDAINWKSLGHNAVLFPSK